MTTKIVVTNDGGRFTADVPDWPGSPLVGRGSTVMAALGDWLAGNRERLDLEIEVQPEPSLVRGERIAWPVETAHFFQQDPEKRTRCSICGQHRSQPIHLRNQGLRR